MAGGGGSNQSGANKLNNDLNLIKKNTNIQDMSAYHQELREWARNVDKRYAWVILFALGLTFAATLGSYRVYGLIFAHMTHDGMYTREEASWPVSMIFSVENLFGPIVSIVAYHISYRYSMLIGSLLIALGNGLAYFSTNLYVDILLIGFVQGLGYAFVFMPFLEVINSYFLRYRNIALGFTLCGGTVAMFALTPLFKWILDTYHWRVAYLAIGLLGCVNIAMVPLMRPNPMPKMPWQGGGVAPAKAKTAKRISVRALTYQNSIRRQSTILIKRNSLNRAASVISVNPFASTAGLERKISRVINSGEQKQQVAATTTTKDHSHNGVSMSTSELQQQQLDYETKSLHDVGQELNESNFGISIIWDVIKTPGWHVIWYLELIYFWLFAIFCLVLVDFGQDRGCTLEQSKDLIMFQSVGEMIGRLGLTVLVDMNFMSHENIVVLNLLILTTLLCVIPYVSGFIWISSLTVALNASFSLLYILLNGLLVSMLGEQKVTIGYGMASFVVGVLITFRPYAVGYFRDQLGSYKWLMISLGMSCALGAILCLAERLWKRFRDRKECGSDEKLNQQFA